MKLYKFYAKWCHNCTEQSEELENNKPSVEVIPMDVDEESNTTLVDFYEIGSLPTVVLTKNGGEMLHKFVGFTLTKDIENEIKKYKD